MPKIPAPTADVISVFVSNHSGPLTLKQIQAELPGYKLKDLKYALRRLREKGVIRSESNLLDMRRVYYRLIDTDEFNMLKDIKQEEVDYYLNLIQTTEEAYMATA